MHGITQFDTFLSSKGAEWHNLCLIFDEAQPFATTYNTAFGKWMRTVRREPIGIFTGDRFVEIPDRFVLIRGDTGGAITQVFSSKYKPVSPNPDHERSFMEICRTLCVNEGLAKVTAIGSTNAGCNLIATFELPPEYSLPGDRPGEKITLYVTVANRFDGSLVIFVSGVRAICENTYRMGLMQGKAWGSVVTVPHRGQFMSAIYKGKSVLGLTSANLERNINEVLTLQSKPLTQPGALSFLYDLNPRMSEPQREDYGDTEEGQKQFDAAVSRVNYQNNQIIKTNVAALNRAEYEAEAITGNKFRLSAWLALNGLTYQIQHKGRTRGVRPIENMIGRLGDRSFDLQQRAVALVTA